jgi:ankyrin repeat protein
MNDSMISYYQNHLEVLNQSLRIDIIVEKHDKDKLIALQIGSSKSHFRIVQTLIEHGSNVNAVNNDGFTPLFLASSYDNFATVQYFIEHGAHVDVSNNSGVTALHFATAFGWLSLVKFLLKYNADHKIGGTNECLSNSLLLARPVTFGGILGDDFADVLTHNIDVMSAIQLVIEFGHFDIVKDLIEKFHCFSGRV